MTESVLFEDSEPPFAVFLAVDASHKKSPHVIVDEGRLKLNNDSYSLAACTGVKTEFLIKPRSYWPIVQIVVCTIVLSLFTLLALGTYVFAPYPKPFQIGDVFSYWMLMVIPWFFAVRGYNAFKVDRYQQAYVVLIGIGSIRLNIGSFRPDPGVSLSNRMRNIGYKNAQIANWRESYTWNAERARLIAEAIGTVIARKKVSL